MLYLETKLSLLRYFWAWISKNYCHIWNQRPRICIIAKFREKMKIPKFGTKNVLFAYFWAGIWKQYCHIWNQLPQVCQIAKFGGKMKIVKFGTKNVLFGYFWARIIVLFEISTLDFIKLKNFLKRWKCLNLGPKMLYLGILMLEFQKTIVIFEISTLEFV